MLRALLLTWIFGDFNVHLIGGSALKPSININGRLELQTGPHTANLELVFDTDIQVLGFDWANSDPTNDSIELIIGGDSWDFGSNQFGGFFTFFGIIASGGTFDTVAFSDTLGGGGALTYALIDNIEYTAISVVPEPSTYLLLGSGIAGLALWRKRRKLKG